MSSSGDKLGPESQYGRLVSIINTFPDQKDPLQALSQKVEQFFRCGPDAAFAALQNLQDAVVGLTYTRRDSRIDVPINSDLGPMSKIFGGEINASTIWRTPTMATALVLLLACDSETETIESVITDKGRTFGGLPKFETTQKEPSSSLAVAFQQAKSSALKGQTTVMVITLHDVHSLELDEQGEGEQLHFNFSHFFTMGVGPEGVRVWQAGGHNGYGLDDYIRDGHARLLNWEEAGVFVQDFEDLASQEGDWTAHVNDLYRRLFHVDINQICGEAGPEPPVTPKFKAWVRIRAFENVTYENVSKFRWVER